MSCSPGWVGQRLEHLLIVWLQYCNTDRTFTISLLQCTQKETDTTENHLYNLVTVVAGCKQTITFYKLLTEVAYLTKESDNHHTASSYFFLKKEKGDQKQLPYKEKSRNRRQNKEHNCIYWHSSTALPQIYQRAKSKGLRGEFNVAVQHKKKPQLPPLPQLIQSAQSQSRASYSQPSFIAVGSFFFWTFRI